MREMPVKRAGEILGESDSRMWRMLFAHVKAAYERLSVTVRRSRLVGGGMALTGGCEDYGWKALASRTGLPGTKGRGHPVPVGAADSAAAGARLSRHPRGVSFQISRCG
ncbi:MAG: hypothetical protein RLZZ582_829 [Verrucomicrobiota bacterium]